MIDDPSLQADRATQPAARKPLVQAGIVLFIGAILFAFAAMMVWPALERARQPSVHPRAVVVNKRPAAVFACAVDAGGGDAYTTTVGAGGQAELTLALGEASTEVDTRTIHLLILDDRGVELWRNTLTGIRTHYIKTIEVGVDSLLLLGSDGKKVQFPEVSP